ncbi:MAG: hypothetical protein HC838_10730 [Spirulinaceae cyanobacterium RM2_2_10]|nr:hypothetical protein [Spirulinaceae cyanobacterium RM2_2_10]
MRVSRVTLPHITQRHHGCDSRQRRDRRVDATIFWGTVSLIATATVGLMLYSQQSAVQRMGTVPSVAPDDATTAELETDILSLTAGTDTRQDPASALNAEFSTTTSVPLPEYPAASTLGSHSVPQQHFEWASLRTAMSPSPVQRAAVAPRTRRTSAPQPAAASATVATTAAQPLVSAPATVIVPEAPQARIERLQTELRGSEEARRVQAHLESLRAAEPTADPVQVSQR